MEEVLAALAERRKLVEPLLKEARAGIIEDEKSNGSGHVERPKKNKTLRTLDPVWNKINGPAFEVMETVLTEGSVSITKGRAKVHVTTQDKSALTDIHTSPALIGKFICPFFAGKDETKIIRMLVKDCKTDDYTQVAKLDDFGASEYDIRTQQKFQYLEQMLIQEGVVQPIDMAITTLRPSLRFTQPGVRLADFISPSCPATESPEQEEGGKMMQRQLQVTINLDDFSLRLLGDTRPPWELPRIHLVADGFAPDKLFSMQGLLKSSTVEAEKAKTEAKLYEIAGSKDRYVLSLGWLKSSKAEGPLAIKDNKMVLTLVNVETGVGLRTQDSEDEWHFELSKVPYNTWIWRMIEQEREEIEEELGPISEPEGKQGDDKDSASSDEDE